MPNHEHIIATPSNPDGLWRTFRRLHREYTGFINVRTRVTGHPWQRRYGSVAMDEEHLHAALRYVALNPVRAHLAGVSSRYVKVEPKLERVCDFAALLSEPFDEALSYAALRKAESIGRQIGSRDWLADMEARTGLTLAPQKRGPAEKAKRKPEISAGLGPMSRALNCRAADSKLLGKCSQRGAFVPA